jgi:hypothetical protein
MTYKLYVENLPELEITRASALAVFMQSDVRHYACSCSCRKCRVYVLRCGDGVISNLRIASGPCEVSA